MPQRGMTYAGMDSDEAKRIAVMRNYYRRRGVDLDPHRVRIVLGMRDHVKNMLGCLQPKERKLVLDLLTPNHNKRRRRKRAD